MKILFLLSQDLESPAGQGRYFPIARELNNLGHEVEIIATQSNYSSKAVNTFTKYGVRIEYVAQMHVKKIGNRKVHFNPIKLILNTMWSTFRLTSKALTHSMDIIIVGKPHPMNGIAGIVTALLRRKRIFLDTDDYEAVSNKFSGKWQQKIVAYFEDHLPLWMDGVTTNTRFNRSRLIQLGVPENRISLIPNCVDRSRFENVDEEKLQGIRQTVGLSNSQKAIVYVGSLSLINHPVDLLISAFDLVRQKLDDTKLIIVGSGDDYEHIMEIARQSKNSSDIVFVGQISKDKVGYYYRLADVTVDPVHDDLIAKARNPLKIVESMFMGTPVVTGDVGDRDTYQSEIVLLVKPGSASSLSEGIIDALSLKISQPEQSKRLNTTWELAVDDFVSHIERIIRLISNQGTSQ